MKIAIIDCRWKPRGQGVLRAEDLRNYLRNNNNAYEVEIFPNVNLGEFVAPNWDNTKEMAIRNGAKPYGVIILHVGPEQTLARDCLGKKAFDDKYVICFTGSSIPPECEQDCLDNTWHCYIKDIGADNTWPEFWKKRILEYIQLLEQGKPEDARNLIMGYDPDLEEVLNTLSEQFSGFLGQNDTPTADQLRDFATKTRDPKFDEWAKKKAAKEAEREKASRS